MTYESNYLAHHGIKGQKWGVITKEYQKIGYDKGRAAANRVINKYTNWNQNRRKNSESPSQVRPKQQKRFDPFALKEFDDKAKKELVEYAKTKGIDFIKNQARDKFIDMLRDDKGRAKIEKGATAIAHALSPVVARLPDPAKVVARGAQYTKSGLRAAAKGGAHVAKAMGKVGAKSFKWLKNGGAKQIRNGAAALRSLLIKHGKDLSVITRSGAGFVRRNIKSISKVSSAALKALLRLRR